MVKKFKTFQDPDLDRQLREIIDAVNTPPAGASPIAVSDEGIQKTAAATSFDFTGPGVTASAAGGAVTVNVPGGGGSTPTGTGWVHVTGGVQDGAASTPNKSDVGLGNADNTSDANKPVSTAQQTAIDAKVTANTAITGATKTKITYDAKGLVTAGADATTADIADSADKRYCTDAQKTVISNTSGTNTGDQTGGTPAITLGTVNSAGSSPNFLRRDDTILAFDATAPSAQAFGDAATVGAAAVAARRDHKHAMMAAPTLPATKAPVSNQPLLSYDSATGLFTQGGLTAGPATQITETFGPTVLTVGAIADGQFARRVGSTLVGAAPGAGSFVATQVVVDLGSTPGDEFEVTVTDGACTSASKVVCSMAYIHTSDNDADEISFSKVFCAAGKPATGSFTASIMAADGPIQGHFAMNYALG